MTGRRRALRDERGSAVVEFVVLGGAHAHPARLPRHDAGASPGRVVCREPGGPRGGSGVRHRRGRRRGRRPGAGRRPDRVPGPARSRSRAAWRSPATAPRACARTGRSRPPRRCGCRCPSCRRSCATSSRCRCRSARATCPRSTGSGGCRDRPGAGRAAPGAGADEDGSISLFILGLALIAMLLIAGAVAVTSAHLSRMRLLDVADGAALSAANALDDSRLRPGRGGVGAAEQPVGAGARRRLPRRPPRPGQHPRVAARARARAPPTAAPPSSWSSARRSCR